jgi:hypothetical protein
MTEIVDFLPAFRKSPKKVSPPPAGGEEGEGD